MSKKVADIIVETLESAGVKHCYGVVGDTLNLIAHGISKSTIEWVGVRHEEAGAFAAHGEALLTGNLTACAGSCGPGSLHFINGIVEANRNRAPVVLIASQIVRDEMGFEFPQEVDFKIRERQRLLRHDPDPQTGPAQDRDGLPDGYRKARSGGTDRPGRYLALRRPQ
jgi:pyruvate dehydrogenase (quinone)